MRIDGQLSALGAITGAAPAAALPALRSTPGVAHLSEARPYDLAPSAGEPS